MDLKKLMDTVKSMLLALAPQFKDPKSEHPVKELKEGLRGGFLLGLVLTERLKDGLQVSDLSALWKKWGDDPEVQKVMKEAVDGYKSIPDEAGDIDAGEGMELVAELADYVPRYVDALKKKEESE